MKLGVTGAVGQWDNGAEEYWNTWTGGQLGDRAVEYWNCWIGGQWERGI